MMFHHFAGEHALRMATSRMERLLRRLSLSSTQLPDDIYVELVDSLFTALAPIIFMGIATAAVSALVAARQHDLVIAELAGAALLMTLVRGLTMQAYRKPPTHHPIAGARGPQVGASLRRRQHCLRRSFGRAMH
jgi:hypothetical protein